MTINRWLEIACEVPEELAEVVSEYLAELSGNGVCMENIAVDAFSHAEINHASTMTLKAYFEDSEDIENITDKIRLFLDNLEGGATLPAPVVATVTTEDWSNSWKVNFKPLHIGRRLLIVPSWEETEPSADDIVLRIDPGMAFGTGGHETTRLCLQLLERIMDSMPTLVSPAVLDLGTGSGILAMAASKLGASRVVALDIDPQAVEIASENLAINGIEGVECSTAPIENIDGQFDLIMANILAEELVRLSTQLSSRLAPAGLLVLSGILAEKEMLVRDGFAKESLKFIETVIDGDWIAILYQKG